MKNLEEKLNVYQAAVRAGQNQISIDHAAAELVKAASAELGPVLAELKDARAVLRRIGETGANVDIDTLKAPQIALVIGFMTGMAARWETNDA